MIPCKFYENILSWIVTIQGLMQTFKRTGSLRMVEGSMTENYRIR